MATTKNKNLTVTIELEDERLIDILENLEIKASQAKVNKLKKLFKEMEQDFYEQLEETLENCLEEIAQEEWGE
jgi:hypothetical protein